MPEVFFVNVNLREGINTDQITSARRKLVSSTACSSCSPLWTINDCLYNCVTLCALHRNNILIFLSRSVIPPVSRSNLVFVVLLFLCHALFCLCYTVFVFCFFVLCFCMYHALFCWLRHIQFCYIWRALPGLFVYRSVFTVDQRPAERIMAHVYSVVRESVQFPSTWHA